MCTLIALLRVVPGYPLVVTMNRDEFYERPSRPPAGEAVSMALFPTFSRDAGAAL